MLLNTDGPISAQLIFTRVMNNRKSGSLEFLFILGGFFPCPGFFPVLGSWLGFTCFGVWVFLGGMVLDGGWGVLGVGGGIVWVCGVWWFWMGFLGVEVWLWKRGRDTGFLFGCLLFVVGCLNLLGGGGEFNSEWE